MTSRLTRAEWFAFVAALAVLAGCSVWQNQRLRAAQLDEKQALYAQRLRTAQVIIENEMLAAAYLTTTDARTRQRALVHLERSPE
jgi:hypothetical protein